MMPLRNHDKPARLHARTTFPAARPPLLVQPHILNGDHVSHDHDFWEAVLILGGSGRHLSARGAQNLAAGDTFLLRPGTWHTFSDCQHLEVYNCCFGVPLLEQELFPFFQDPTINHLLIAGPQAAQSRGMMRFHLSNEESSACRDLLESIRCREKEDTAFADRERMAFLVLFLSRLARVADASTSAAPLQARYEPIHPAACRMMNLLEDDIGRAWTIQDLAKTVHLEGAYCISLFKKATGLSPIAYLSRTRAERAASLLLRTSLPIAEIARRIGWTDQNYFARRFRAHFGISATEYRNRFFPANQEPMGGADANISDAPRRIKSS